MDVFDEMFGSFREQAFRIETFPIYKIEGGEWEEFKEYEAGKVLCIPPSEDWIDDLRRWRLEGKKIKRIRILPQELNNYLRYEIEWCYIKNYLAGEDFAFVGQNTYKKYVEKNTFGDFWLFDKKYVLKMQYDANGSYLGEKLFNDISIVEDCLDLFRKLEQESHSIEWILNKIRSSKIKIDIH